MLAFMCQEGTPTGNWFTNDGDAKLLSNHVSSDSFLGALAVWTPLCFSFPPLVLVVAYSVSSFLTCSLRPSLNFLRTLLPLRLQYFPHPLQ